MYLFVSFPSRAESVGLELCEALSSYCNAMGKKNFELFVRLSKEGVNKERWSEQFVNGQLSKFSLREINRIWVCGPPVMNETFDRAFKAIQSPDGGKLQPQQFEIL